MCGIFCYINFSKKNSKSIDFLKQYFDSINHRGPDDYRLLQIDDNIIFGFHRLSINGLDQLSGQPMSINSRIHLICNGEIYNYKELAHKYNIKLNTNSDCEIIMHLFLIIGMEGLVNEINSEASFVLYDSLTRKLYCYRDHLGIRPLFIGLNSNNINFNKYNIFDIDNINHDFNNMEIFLTSEIKAIPPYVNNIQQFKPGYYSSINCITHYNTLSQYYNFNYKINNYLNNENDVYNNIRSLLTKAVKDRLISDRPIGSFLSGGLDSSIITSILSQYNKNIHVFTIGLEGSPDISAAKDVAKFLNLTNHHIVPFTIQQGIESLDDVIKSIESYDITTVRASTPQWILSKYIKENTNITVLFSGECIDEMIGYYYLKFLNDNDFISETTRMLKELYLYDLLRTDRTISNFSLEVRVPFADRTFIDYIMSLPLKFRKFGHSGFEIEKHLIRNSFKGYLPDNVLWRKKHAFSDSVSNSETSWYKSIENYAKLSISDDLFNKRFELYPFNTPHTYEAFLYRSIFEKHFPGRSNVIPHYWMPKINGKNIDNPSATILDGFSEI